MVDTTVQSNKPYVSAQTSHGYGNLFVISGPSGVGKGTSVQRLLQIAHGLSRSISVTTRAKRAEEIEGVDYFFRDRQEFERMREDGEFLEWAEFAGSLYGTPKSWVAGELKAGNDVILEIEVKGARQVRDHLGKAILIFLSPPSFETLEERLTSRATESPDKIKVRLDQAREEMAQKHLFDYEVINDNIDVTVNNLVHILYAERCRIRIPG